MPTDDYYREARALADTLDTEGLAKDARAIRDAISAASTGTELVMAVRWHLNRLLEPGASLSALTLSRVRDLRDDIDRALAR